MENQINKLKKMYFDPIIAEKIGVDEAIMYHNIKFWCNKNAEKGDPRHFHEDVCWMFNSVRSFQEQLPFWTESQIKRILRNLVNFGYIKKGCFNRIGYDKTSWYTVLVSDEVCTEKKEPLDEEDPLIF